MEPHNQKKFFKKRPGSSFVSKAPDFPAIFPPFSEREQKREQKEYKPCYNLNQKLEQKREKSKSCAKRRRLSVQIAKNLTKKKAAIPQPAKYTGRGEANTVYRRAGRHVQKGMPSPLPMGRIRVILLLYKSCKLSQGGVCYGRNHFSQHQGRTHRHL